MSENTILTLANSLKEFFTFARSYHFKITNMRAPEITVLFSLFNKENGKTKVKTPSEMCNDTGFSKSALTSILNNLEDQEMITRTVDKKDRRKVLVSLTQKAIDFRENFEKAHFNHIEEIYNKLGKEDTEKFIQIINKILN